MKLTEKQKKFADYYLQSGNASESYIRAGYKNYKTANVEASKTLKNPNVWLYIQEKNKSIASKRIADMVEIKEFWTSIIRDEEEETKDRLKASELIAKTNGAFIEKVEHSGEVKTNNPLKDLTTEELRQLIKK